MKECCIIELNALQQETINLVTTTVHTELGGLYKPAPVAVIMIESRQQPRQLSEKP